MEKKSGSVPDRKRALDDIYGRSKAVSEVDPLKLATPEKKFVQYNRKSKKQKEQSIPLIETAFVSGDEDVGALDKILEGHSLIGAEDVGALDKIPGGESLIGAEDLGALDKISGGDSLIESQTMDALAMLCGDDNLPDLLKNPSFISRMNARLGTSLSIHTTSSVVDPIVNPDGQILPKVTNLSTSSIGCSTNVMCSDTAPVEVETISTIAQISLSTPSPWRVKVRVIEKGFPRLSRNSINPVTYLRSVLMDEEGTRIQATIFGDDVDLMGNKLNLLKMCFVCDAVVQPIPIEHRVVANEFRWIINSKSSCIEPILDDNSGEIVNPYNLVPFTCFDNYLGSFSTIDVLAVVVNVFSRKTVNTIHGLSSVQDVLLVDQTLKPITLTLWDQFVDQEGSAICQILHERVVIVATRVKVTSYNGVSLSTKSSSSILINPDFPEANDLRSWSLLNNDVLQRFVSNVIKFVSEPPRNVFAIKDAVRLTDIDSFWIKGKVSLTNFRQAFWYMACSGCNRKTDNRYENVFYCTSCKSNTVIARPRSRVEVQIDDSCDCLDATLFGEQADAILGCDAITIMKNMTVGGHSTISTMMNISRQELYFELRPNIYPHDKDGQKRYNIHEIRQLQPNNEFVDGMGIIKTGPSLSSLSAKDKGKEKLA